MSEDPCAEAVAVLRGLFAARRFDALALAIEALRARDPDHPDVALATAALLAHQGRPVEAAAARLCGYDRALARTGDPEARRLLEAALAAARAGADSYQMLQTAAARTRHPGLLDAFVAAALEQGQFAEAADALARLEYLTERRDADAHDTLALGRRVAAHCADDQAAADGLPGLLHEWAARRAMAGRLPLHHSGLTAALIGGATRAGAPATGLAEMLVVGLRALDCLGDAAVSHAARLLLTLGQDAGAEAFLDATAHHRTRASSLAILDHAIGAAIARGAPAALERYGRRLDAETGCPSAGLVRITGRLGVEARHHPAWAEWLRGLTRSYPAAPTAAAAARQRSFPALVTAPLSDERIDVFLKCVRRPFDIRPFLAFWLDCFDDPTRYRIRLLDDSGLDLTALTDRYTIHSQASLRAGMNEARALFDASGRPLNLLGWESVANLTPFAQTGTRWFWNIDADDIRPLLAAGAAPRTLRPQLRAVEAFARERNLMAISYDLWASVHYLIEHGYHWTFGIALCRSDPPLLGAMLASLAGCDVPQFKINLDHLLSRLADGSLAGGRYANYFSSFAFDRLWVHQKDLEGIDIFHGVENMRKLIKVSADNAIPMQDRLHTKTLLV